METEEQRRKRKQREEEEEEERRRRDNSLNPFDGFMNTGIPDFGTSDSGGGGFDSTPDPGPSFDSGGGESGGGGASGEF